jgi:hypothetical protein
MSKTGERRLVFDSATTSHLKAALTAMEFGSPTTVQQPSGRPELGAAAAPPAPSGPAVKTGALKGE